MEKTKVVFIGSGRLDWSLIQWVLERADIEVVAVIDPSITTDFKTSVMVHDKVDGQSKLVNVTAKDSKTLLIGDKEVALIGIQNPEQIPWLDTGAELIFDFSGLITNNENAAAHFNGGAKVVIAVPLSKDVPVVFASGVSCSMDHRDPLIKVSHCWYELIKNWKDTRDTKKTLFGPSSSNDWILNIPDPVSAGDAKTVGYAYSAPDHEMGVGTPLTRDDVGAPDSAAGSRPSWELTDFRESLLDFLHRHRNEFAHWARVLHVINRAADLATRAAHLASLAWFTGAGVLELIDEIAEMFN